MGQQIPKRLYTCHVGISDAGKTKNRWCSNPNGRAGQAQITRVVQVVMRLAAEINSTILRAAAAALDSVAKGTSTDSPESRSA